MHNLIFYVCNSQNTAFYRVFTRFQLFLYMLQVSLASTTLLLHSCCCFRIILMKPQMCLDKGPGNVEGDPYGQNPNTFDVSMCHSCTTEPGCRCDRISRAHHHLQTVCWRVCARLAWCVTLAREFSSFTRSGPSRTSAARVTTITAASLPAIMASIRALAFVCAWRCVERTITFIF